MPVRTSLHDRATRVAGRVFLVCIATVLSTPLCTSMAEELPLASEASPTLSAFARQILQSHPRVQAAQAELEAARARERGAGRAIYNPEIYAEY